MPPPRFFSPCEGPVSAIFYSESVKIGKSQRTLSSHLHKIRILCLSIVQPRTMISGVFVRWDKDENTFCNLENFILALFDSSDEIKS